MRNWALVGLLVYKQSIEIGAYFKEHFFVEKTSLKITFKHHLSEMLLLHEKVQHLSFHYAQRQTSFPFTELSKKEDGT